MTREVKGNIFSFVLGFLIFSAVANLGLSSYGSWLIQSHISSSNQIHVHPTPEIKIEKDKEDSI